MNKLYKDYCYEGAVPSIIINKARSYTKEQSQGVLKRLLAYIQTGDDKPHAVDSEATGDKYTECDWGFCTGHKEMYPTADLHIFPSNFDQFGQVSRLEHKIPCPMRDGYNKSGCFYQCRVFQAHLHTPTKEEAIALITAQLKT